MSDAPTRPWTFLSNHGHVLVAISRSPHAKVRELAASVGISERAALSIVGDLESAGYITKHRVGRRNTYRLDPHRHLRHPAESSTRVAALLAIFEVDGDDGDDAS
ncbi:helix-turn-helix transcriptional regulator [Phycicoccus duodecadis]|jgi:DNA-binding MarR family transcriptional regulator|uniref:Winged helix-turn-helix DNA-binding protein n=1 Tax=Phycicoccus duodecadis TaxID=173053 RepID=A0A2N3YI20_9MICO|nr:winged helix-turn-helix domain-containing protein [Phycicoccus duodecadis]PKW26490.1 winged helix-turn-helix DNA-binding protein [Phycicoccus duodecadis]